MRQLLEGHLDRARYARLLQGHHRLHRAWERQHAAWLAAEVATAGWAYLNRSERLAADLAALGLSPEDEPSPPSSRSSSQVVGGPSGSWGALYVIEGAALGGQVMLKRLQAQFPDHPHHFFGVGLEQAHAPWRQFQAMLDIRLPSSSSLQAAIAEARGMFLRVQRMLEAVSR